jgi:hypothetical protein
VKLMARGVFSGELNPDPESAAADLAEPATKFS